MLGCDDRERNTSASTTMIHFILDCSKDQVFDGPSLAGRFALEPAVERVRDINYYPHSLILPHLRRNMKRLKALGSV